MFLHYLECGCNVLGSASPYCNGYGICTCISNVTGIKCSECKSGHFNFPTCSGKFLIYINHFFINPLFDQHYIFLWYNMSWKFVNCLYTIFLACNCVDAGSSSISCNSSGDCFCKTGYYGQKCSDCLPGYHKSGTDCLGKIF